MSGGQYKSLCIINLIAIVPILFPLNVIGSDGIGGPQHQAALKAVCQKAGAPHVISYLGHLYFLLPFLFLCWKFKGCRKMWQKKKKKKDPLLI